MMKEYDLDYEYIVDDTIYDGPEGNAYGHDKDYFESETPYITSDMLEPDHYAKIEAKARTKSDMMSVTALTDAAGNPIQTMVKTTAAATGTTTTDIKAVEKNWKKPVLIGAACLAAIWFFKE